MKHSIILLVFLSQLLVAQEQVNSINQLDNKILEATLRLTPGINIEPSVSTVYFDRNMKSTSKSNAYFTVVKKFHSNNYVIKGVGTYDDGYVHQADKQELKNFSLIGYYPNGNEAFNILSLHTEKVPTAYYLEGDAVWYREDGSLMAKGRFNSGHLKGTYIEYDEFGEETKKAMFNESKVVNLNEYNSSDNQYMVGDWVEDQGSWFLDSKQGKDLHNEYLPDGTLNIYICYYYQPEGLPRESENCDDPNVTNYKYIPKTDTQGIVEIYHEGDLIEKEAITFINKNEYKSKTVYSRDNTSAIGMTFHFKRQ